MASGASMSELVSRRISILRLLFCCFVILIHSHDPSFPWRGHPISEALAGWQNWAVETLYDDIFRTAVPAFYIFSGYLLFVRSKQPTWDWKKEARKRVARLAASYLTWNLVFIVFWLGCQRVSIFRPYFSGRTLPLDGWDVWTLFSIWFGVLRLPIDTPLWFLRDLILLTAVSGWLGKGLRQLNRFGMVAAVLTLVFLEITIFRHYSSLNYSLVWFSVGCWFGIHQDIPQIKSIPKVLVTMGWLLLAAWRGHQLMAGPEYALGWLSASLGFMSLWSWSAAWTFKPGIALSLERLAHASFFIYALHILPLVALRKLSIRILQHSELVPSLVVLYLFVPVATVLICLIFYFFTLGFPVCLQRLLHGGARQPHRTI